MDVNGTIAKWPMKSIALAVHASQVQEANERNRRHGVLVQYEPGTGLAIIPSENEKRKLMRLESLISGKTWFDRDAWY